MTFASAGVALPAAADDIEVAQAAHVSCTGKPNEIRIVVKNVKKSIGLVTADLYRNDASGFLHKGGRVGRARFAAKAPVTVFCIDAPSADAYAVAVYHDKNANKAFDKNPLGLPAEPFGLSNNPKMRLAPPKIEEALFEVAADGAIVEIELNN
jgi:uncharacterized protein (DUF2141 family)